MGGTLRAACEQLYNKEIYMKKKERYKLINHAVKEYSRIFNRDYQLKKISKKELLNLVDTYKYPVACEWSYCCYGLYDNCWQEPIEDGIWAWTQESVNKYIKSLIKRNHKRWKKDNRIAYCEKDGIVHIVIIDRDTCKNDYLLYFTNEWY